MSSKAENIMTNNPCCCVPDTKLQEVAKMMVEHDCGEIPVVDDLNNRRIMGVITDRDIVCRTLAKNISPIDVVAADVMTYPPVTVSPYASLDECCELLEKNRIRRIPVVDDFDRICGIISQADIVRKDQDHVLEVLREVSSQSETVSSTRH